MPLNLSIKSAPDEIVQKLKLRAERNHRSLQGEMLAILEAAVKEEAPLSIDQLFDETRQHQLVTPSESQAMLRGDRDQR